MPSSACKRSEAAMVVVALARDFFFNDTATTEIYTLSLHDALPISMAGGIDAGAAVGGGAAHGEGVRVAGIDVAEGDLADRRHGAGREAIAFGNIAIGRAHV